MLNDFCKGIVRPKFEFLFEVQTQKYYFVQILVLVWPVTDHSARHDDEKAGEENHYEQNVEL